MKSAEFTLNIQKYDYLLGSYIQWHSGQRENIHVTMLFKTIWYSDFIVFIWTGTFYDIAILPWKQDNVTKYLGTKPVFKAQVTNSIICLNLMSISIKEYSIGLPCFIDIGLVQIIWVMKTKCKSQILLLSEDQQGPRRYFSISWIPKRVWHIGQSHSWQPKPTWVEKEGFVIESCKNATPQWNLAGAILN